MEMNQSIAQTMTSHVTHMASSYQANSVCANVCVQYPAEKEGCLACQVGHNALGHNVQDFRSH